MKRASVKHEKQNARLTLQRETIRSLGDSELAVVQGGGNCIAETNRRSSCTSTETGQ